jgi:DMSO/TMAO reductase YedYZ molybdopterin-dependent catalytic subunit
MQPDAVKFREGKIVRGEEPLNLEMPFEQLDTLITPTASFYVRTHFPIPKIDKNMWRLRVEGAVERACEFSFNEIVRLGGPEMPVTLECAGNNRSLLEPKVKGVQWALGAVGTAMWTGVPLSALLDRAGVKPNAREVILEGADGGELEDAKAPRGQVRFARSIPLEKARSDVLLAYRMNNVDLPPEHGFPVRAIVPGWYAMASIKWLTRIIVIERPFTGYYQTLDYAFWRNGELVPLREMQIKAQIARPVNGETVPANSNLRVHGAAWSSAEIQKVELSVDGGSTWNEARLLGESTPNAWRLWEYDWRTTAAGSATLIARAFDSRVNAQPLERDWNRGTYMINHLLPITVKVRM